MVNLWKMDPTIDVSRRIRAAREIAGFRSVEALAEVISQAGFGVKTLRAMERGDRVARPMELREIAGACGLPYAFFTMPFEVLDAVAADLPEQELLAREGHTRDEPAAVVVRALDLYTHHLQDLADDIPFDESPTLPFDEVARAAELQEAFDVAWIRSNILEQAAAKVLEHLPGQVEETVTAMAEKRLYDILRDQGLLELLEQPTEGDALPAPADALIRPDEADPPTTRSERGRGGLRAVDSPRGKS